MAMAHLVYPGAMHSRLQHSLGAYHLMRCALLELTGKGFDISSEEKQAACIAILLHDIGHGPFSHALEHVIAEGRHHEDISLEIFQEMNREMGGELSMAIEIFTGNYPKKYLHQLISGQLDVDRMDYLTRDSFFTGVSEGVIGYDRILKMLTIHNGELMVEEKGIYSIEKFLVARRLMYWQVYLHKTVLSAEQMLRKIIGRARHIGAECPEPLRSLLYPPSGGISLKQFCKLDDYDVMSAIKSWAGHEDKVLSILCSGIINRMLLKVNYYSEAVKPEIFREKELEVIKSAGICEEDKHWLVFSGEASSRTYDFEGEKIKILFKDGTEKDISGVDNALINENLRGKVKKYYICYYSNKPGPVQV